MSLPVALVTGAARGIGAATVRRLVADGWAVVAVDRCADDPALPYALASRAELQALADEAEPGRVVPVVGDVRDEDELREAVRAAQELGGLDAALAVAGVLAGGPPLWEMPAPAMRAVLDVSLLGTATLARVAIPAMLDRPPPRRGRFVAVSSAAGRRGMHGIAAYGAAKAGVEGLVRGLAADLRGTGITANAVSPGSTATELLDESARLYGLPGAASFAPRQTLERLLDPAEVAAALAWLCGPEASALTGATVPADGGLSL